MPVSRNAHNISSIEKTILTVVEETIAAHHMLQQNDRVLVAVSGGPDSVALLHILVSVSSRLSIHLGVAHLNHSLRQHDSDEDAAFVLGLSKELDLPCFMEKIDIRAIHREKKQSLEETARNVRYAFFQRIAEENCFNKIATGHHQEDNAEVILMDMIRGCGPKGISGIPPVRNGRIIRPLIALSQSSIHKYLKVKGHSFRTDASNREMRYVRNRVRHQLIPLLKSSYNPNIIETLNRLAAIVQSEELWIDETFEPVFKKAVLSQIGEKEIVLSADMINEQPMALQRRIVRKAICRVKGNLRRIRLSHIDSVIRLLKKTPAYGCLDMPDRIRANLTQDRIVFSREKTSLRKQLPKQAFEKKAFSLMLTKPGRIALPNSSVALAFSIIPIEGVPVPIPPGHHVVFVDMDRLHFPLTIRNVQPGDRFVPLGMKGSQKISTFFINQKVPRSCRATCPVLVNYDNHIVWVVGYRLDDAFRITSSTQNVLMGELLLA